MSFAPSPAPVNSARDLPVPLPAWTPPGAQSAPEEIPLAYYWMLLRRHALRIATLVVVVTTCVTLFTLSLPKQYDAFAVVRVDSGGNVQVGPNQPVAATDPLLLLTTEQRVAVGSAVVSHTIDNLKLDQVPEFTASLRATDSPDQRRAALIDELTSKHIEAVRPANSMLLEIHFQSKSPTQSALIANGLAAAFLEQEYSTRSNALTDSSKSMSQQLDQLRAAMEQGQQALVNYETQSDVLDPDDHNNIVQARLSQLNQALSDAEADRVKLQTADQLALGQNLDALLITEPGAALIPLQRQVETDQQQLDRMATLYGPRHPLYLQQQALVAKDQQALRTAATHVAQQVQNEYAAARNREALLQASLSQQRQAMDDYQRRAIRYRDLKAAADGATNLYYSLQQRMQDAEVSANLHGEDLRIINPARADYSPVFPRTGLAASLAFLASLMLGCLGAIMSGMRDRTFVIVEQVEHFLHLPTLALLPKVGSGEDLGSMSAWNGVAALGDGKKQLARSSFHEMIVGLHSAIQFALPDGVSVLALSSALPGEGKSTICAHLAASFAALGQSTVLVDADMRKPRGHRMLGMSNRVGLSTVLRGECDLTQALQIVPGIARFSFLAAGPAVNAPSELLHLSLGDVVERLRERFAVILLDCPPVLGFADAVVIANHCDQVILAVHAGTTQRDLVIAAVRQLRQARGHLTGIVLNQINADLDLSYGYQSYYNEYYQNASEDQGQEGEDD